MLARPGDNAEADPTGADLDVLSFRSADGNQSGLLELGLLPEASNSWTLSDVDLLSGSYGAGSFVTADIGPDITDEPVIHASILGSPDDAFVLEILGEPVLGPLNDFGASDNLIPLAIANDLLSGGLGGDLLSGGLGGDLLAGGLTDGLLSGGLIPAGLGDVVPTDVVPLGILGGLLGDVV